MTTLQFLKAVLLSGSRVVTDALCFLQQLNQFISLLCRKSWETLKILSETHSLFFTAQRSISCAQQCKQQWFDSWELEICFTSYLKSKVSEVSF